MGGWGFSEASVHAYADFLSAKQQTGWRAYKNHCQSNKATNEEKNHRDRNPPDHEVLGFASSLHCFVNPPGSPKQTFCRTWSHCSSHCMFSRHIRRAFDVRLKHALAELRRVRPAHPPIGKALLAQACPRAINVPAAVAMTAIPRSCSMPQTSQT